MGNRCYFTIQHKHYYMHWNGGMDTFAPLAKTLFDNDCNNVDHAIKFMESMELRPELQESADAYNWTDENGHYYIDLTNKVLYHRKDDDNAPRLAVLDLEETFNSYLRDHISEDYQEKTRECYWHGIIDAGKEFFKKENSDLWSTSNKKERH